MFHNKWNIIMDFMFLQIKWHPSNIGGLLDQGQSDPRNRTTMFQNVIKNSPKFRLSVEWVGKTSNKEDFGDVTLAWEDDEQGRTFLFDNFKWKWKYHESTLAREYEEQERW